MTEGAYVLKSDNSTVRPNVRVGRWPEDERLLRDLRSTVFINEQGVPADIEWDGRDAEAQHVIAELNDRPVACGRLLADGRIGRLAVLAEHRRRGIGLQLLNLLLQLAKEQGLGSVYLHAQADAINFYLRAGFEARGERFLEAGIEHLDMAQQLDYRDWSSSLSRVDYPEPFAQLAVIEAERASRELRILSPNLDSRVFDQEDFLGPIRKLVRRGRMTRVQIIVQNPRALSTRGHGMLKLARRMPSSVELRKLSEHPAWNESTMMIRDREGLLSIPAGERSPGVYKPRSRRDCETAITLFDDLWRAGTTDPEFRALSL